jgi:hypothetical protein
MASLVRIALITYLVPLTSTRAVRFGFLLLFFMVASVALAVSLDWVSRVATFLPEDATETMLANLRRFIVVPGIPFAAVLFSELPVRDGIRQRTLLYPLLGPVPRSMLAVVRTLATGMLLAAGGVVLLTVVRILEGAGLAALPREALALTLGAFTYIALFGVFHLLSRFGLFASLGFVFLDSALATVPFGLRRVAPSFHVRNLADHTVDMELPMAIRAATSPEWVSALVLVAITAVAVGVAGWLFTRKRLGTLC